MLLILWAFNNLTKQAFWGAGNLGGKKVLIWSDAISERFFSKQPCFYYFLILKMHRRQIKFHPALPAADQDFAHGRMAQTLNSNFLAWNSSLCRLPWLSSSLLCCMSLECFYVKKLPGLKNKALRSCSKMKVAAVNLILLIFLTS